LYFRLKVLELHLPSLRERRGDLPLLVDHLLKQSWRRAGERPYFTARAEQTLCGYAWPGNVRELSHVVERACLLATGPELGLDLLPPEVAPQPEAPST